MVCQLFVTLFRLISLQLMRFLYSHNIIVTFLASVTVILTCNILNSMLNSSKFEIDLGQIKLARFSLTASLSTELTER